MIKKENFTFRLAVVFSLLVVFSCAILGISVYVAHINAAYQEDFLAVNSFSYNFNRMLQEQARYLNDFGTEHRALYNIYLINTKKELDRLHRLNMMQEAEVLQRVVEAIEITFNVFENHMNELIATIDKSQLEVQLLALTAESIVVPPGGLSRAALDELILRTNILREGMGRAKQVTNINTNINLVYQELDRRKKNIDMQMIILINVLSWLIIASQIVISIITVLKMRSLIKTEREALAQVESLNADLEARVVDRTEQLRASMETLKRAQEQLIESEKMAALGQLVAGVSHEINTPIGVGVTAASFLQEKCDTVLGKFQTGDLKKSELERFLDVCKESSHTLLSNLQRAAQLVGSFKQVAVDQTVEDPRRFEMTHYLADIMLSLRPKLKKAQHIVNIESEGPVYFFGPPGVFSQILTNLVMNSLIHGFGENFRGTITINVKNDADAVTLTYTDNGAGMDKETARHVFEPFFTTKRGSGGTGLGMHIVYNIVTMTLHGSIRFDSEPGRGVVVTMTLPHQKKA